MKERAIVIPGIRAMGINTYLVASPLISSDSIKVAQDNECITMGTLVQYRVKFKLEHLFHSSFTLLGRTMHWNNRHES